MVEGRPIYELRWQWLPSPVRRAEARARTLAYPRESFASEADFFFFTHIDPVQRFWHVLGFLSSFLFFPSAVFAWADAQIARGVVLWSVGVACFYGFGLLSHQLYDGGTGASRPSMFWRSIPWALDLNWQTLGRERYRRRLAAFIARYPFVTKAYRLGADDV